jgi:hypothetical protein
MALLSAALLVAAASGSPIIPTSPFIDMAAFNHMMSKALLQDPPHIDMHCGEMDLVVELTLPRAERARDIQIAGPGCADGRIENLEKAIARTPRSAFVAVDRTTRYRFKLRIKLPAADAQ